MFRLQLLVFIYVSLKLAAVVNYSTKIINTSLY